MIDLLLGERRHLLDAETKETYKQKYRKKEKSYLTLFLLKDKAALFPFVRRVVQFCTTTFHPRPKCGTNIHKYINIKISPIKQFLPIKSNVFLCTCSTAYVPCLWKDVLVSLCLCVCGSVWMSSVTSTRLSNPTGAQNLEEKVRGPRKRWRDLQ